MGWFSNNKEEKKVDSLPELPDLPELPELPELNLQQQKPERNFQLPSFPTNALGERFSQNAIKEAVSGGKGGGRYADGGDLEMPQMKQAPKARRFTREQDEEIPEEFMEASQKLRKTEPVFIRIDKFEEALKIFEETKKKIEDIEKMLQDLKRIKEKEEEELNSWEEEIKEAKEHIYKIDQEIFSKIE